MSNPTVSVPPSLASVLRAAGFRGSVVVERLDGQPMTEAQQALARGLVEHHEDQASNEDVSRAVGAYLDRQKTAEKSTPPALAPTGTGGE